MSTLGTQELKTFLKGIKKTRIAIVGDSMIDIFSYGKTERLSPEAPVPVIELLTREFILGGAANVARNIRSLGGNVVLFSVVGKDENGTLLSKLLSKDTVESALLSSKKRPTTVKERIIESSKHFVRIDIESRDLITKEEETRLIEKFKKESQNIDVLIFSDYAKGVITQRLVNEFCKIAEKRKIPVVVDTKPKNAKLFCGKKITLFTPNAKEAYDISGKKNMMEASKYLQDFFKTAILVTKGEEGMTLYENDKSTHINAHSSVVVDVSGCGDTVIATLALALSVKKSLTDSMFLANHSAGIVVKKKGTAIVTPKEFLLNDC